MKVVVVGDISLGGQYHLGDEAMTEAAIAQLKRHGADVTLIAGDPELSAEYYQVRTIRRLGFRQVARPRKLRMLSELDSALSGEADVPKSMAPAVDAVRVADAVVIAGGGNLNSNGEHHLFERLALKRMAEFFGVPLFLSSQTVGPKLSTRDKEVVKEIARYATVVGVREQSSARLMKDLVRNPKKIVLTFDDAVLVPHMAGSSVPTVDLDLPDRYVVGSFTYHVGTTELTGKDYYRTIASALDQIVSTCDVDIVLLPHMGHLGVGETKGRDCAGHARIAGFMTSPRVHQLPVLSAAQTVSVTAGADFTVSTRYHPVVFGPAVGTPAIGLVTSHYTMTRMHGVLENFGLGTFAVPFEGWDLFGPKIIEALAADREELTGHLADVGTAAVRYQTAWWDGIADRIRRSGGVVKDDLPTLPTYDWGTRADRESFSAFKGVHDALNRTRQRLSLDAAEQAREVEDLTQQIGALAQESRRLKQNLAARAKETATSRESLQQQIDELRERQRPPGAALRDGVRRRVRRRKREKAVRTRGG